MSTTLQRPVARIPAKSIDGSIITVASGKGGVGKTWFAITLAHALTRQGSRVLLFDGDLGLANIDIQLGLLPERDLGSVISGRFTLREAVTRYTAGGFDVVVGRSGSAALSSLPRQQLLQLREQLLALAKRYDYVVIDLGAGVDTTVRLLGASGGTNLVLATDEPTALTDAYAYIKVTTAQQRDADIRVVVNMAASGRDGERTYAKLLKACQSFLKLSPGFAGLVRRDERVRDAIRHQAPLLSRHPMSEAGADVESLVARLTGRT